MDIEKHAQMMRWLTRPRSQVPGPRNMYAGGQLVAPSVDGSRPGYQGDPYKRTTVYKKRQEAKKKGLTYDVKTKKFKPLKATAQDTEQSIKMINDWTKEWINKNSKNYGVREFDKFKKDLAGDWKKQLKVFEKNPKFRFPKTGPGSTLISTADGLPYVRGLDIDKVTTPIKKDPTLGYEKIFYNKKLQNPEFKKKVTEYLDFVNLDKRYGSVRDEMAAAGKIATDPEGKGFFKKSSGSKKAYLEYAKFADDDVVYFFGDVLNSRKLWNNNPASLNIYGILEQNVDPKKVRAYRKKLNTTYTSWMNNLKEVADLAGVDFNKVLQAQYDEAFKMKQLFNVENLPFEFQYAQDHLFGLSEAKNLGDPKIAKQTLKNLVASTKEQNRYLGTKGFTQRRSKLMRQFKNASLKDKPAIITKLNNLSEEYVPGRLKYDVRKDGSLKITNLQPEKTFKARAAGYEKITKTFPKNIQKHLTPKHQQLIKNNFCGNKDGLSPGSCPINEAIDNMIKQTNDVRRGAVKGAEAARIASKASKVARFGTGTGLAKALGPYGLAAEAVFEIGLAVPGYVRGESGKRLLGDSILGLIPGVGQSAEEEFTEYATKAGMSELEQQKIKDANRFSELSESLYNMQQAGILEGRGAGRGGQHRGINKFMELQEEYIPLYNQFVGAPPSEDVNAAFAEQDRINQTIEEAKAVRRKQRQDSGIVAQDDWYTNVNTRGYMGGGIASLKKKW